MPDDTENKLQAHFWITATTLAVHAFLVSETSQEINIDLAVTVGKVVWFLATYNIVEIAGSRDVKSPEYNSAHGLYCRKLWETIGNFQVLYKRMLFVVLEFKGAFFYSTLVFFSFAGVLSASGIRCPVIKALLWLSAIFVLSWFLDYGCSKLQWCRPRYKSQ